MKNGNWRKQSSIILEAGGNEAEHWYGRQEDISLVFSDFSIHSQAFVTKDEELGRTNNY